MVPCAPLWRLIKTQTLSTVASVSLPKSYNRALDGLAVAEGIGACGTAAALGEPVLVADMRKDERFSQFRSLIDQQGLVACWSHPILQPLTVTLLELSQFTFQSRECL